MPSMTGNLRTHLWHQCERGHAQTERAIASGANVPVATKRNSYQSQLRCRSLFSGKKSIVTHRPIFALAEGGNQQRIGAD